MNRRRDFTQAIVLKADLEAALRRDAKLEDLDVVVLAARAAGTPQAAIAGVLKVSPPALSKRLGRIRRVLAQGIGRPELLETGEANVTEPGGSEDADMAT